MFDVTYEFNLDKNLSSKLEYIGTTNKCIESTERAIKHRDKNMMLKKVKKIGKII